MSKVDRNKPRRSSASESRYTIFEFEAEFPNDAACLDYLVSKLYPEGIYCPTCERVTKHHRIKTRTAYSCQFCGHYEYPMKGTIFEGSATSLKLWFYAIHLMASTRGGISAKQLERELGVTYKTAWRMFNKIRSLLHQDDDDMLDGKVEIDETFVGGKPRRKDQVRDADGRIDMSATIKKANKKQTSVFGAVERGGRVRATIVPDRTAATLGEAAKSFVLPSSTVFTDDWKAYRSIGKGYKAHHRINHSERIYVSGDVHTQTIEGFWSLVKRGIGGTYHAVSTKWLQGYLNEFVWRYNRRHEAQSMFRSLILRAAL